MLSISSSYYGQQIYRSCLSLYGKTRDSCKEVAIRTLDQASEWGARIGYGTGNARLLNAMLSYRGGGPITIEKARLSDLHLAARFGTVADVKAAIKKEGNLNVKDCIGNTPLHFSVMGPRGSQAFRLLLSSGAEVNEKGVIGMTPLHFASIHIPEAVIALLKAGADLEAKDQFGNTPLHYAARAGHAQIVSILLKAGANIEAKNNHGYTPLLSAVSKEQKDSIRTLVANGADINAKNSIGATPLGWAVSRSRINILRILQNTESHPSYASEKALHQYFDQMFHPCRDRLPRNLKWLEKMKKELNGSVDPLQELRLVAQCDPISSKESADMLVDMLITLEEDSSSPTLDVILQGLIQRSPLFAKAWELANRHEKITLFEYNRQPNVTPAFYCPLTHKIGIAKSLNIPFRTGFLVFETFNALQRDAYRNIEKLAQKGMLDREEYTLLKEYIEFENSLWAGQILNNPKVEFIDFWKKHNTEQLDLGSYIHADIYREAWDLSYGFLHLQKHQL